MALRLSVIQSPITWFSLCLCLLVYFSSLLSCTTVILSLVTWVYLCLLPPFFLNCHQFLLKELLGMMSVYRRVFFFIRLEEPPLNRGRGLRMNLYISFNSHQTSQNRKILQNRRQNIFQFITTIQLTLSKTLKNFFGWMRCSGRFTLKFGEYDHMLILK